MSFLQAVKSNNVFFLSLYFKTLSMIYLNRKTIHKSSKFFFSEKKITKLQLIIIIIGSSDLL